MVFAVTGLFYIMQTPHNTATRPNNSKAECTLPGATGNPFTDILRNTVDVCLSRGDTFREISGMMYEAALSALDAIPDEIKQGETTPDELMTVSCYAKRHGMPWITTQLTVRLSRKASKMYGFYAVNKYGIRTYPVSVLSEIFQNLI